MTEETMLDRVSKMLAEEVSRLTGQRIKADDFGTRPIARAVLEVMSEPTEAMREKGADQLFASSSDAWGDDAEKVYRAMIDAAHNSALTPKSA